jgi:primosomal protein N' (replication factor Y)
VIIVKVILPLPIRQYFKYFLSDIMYPIIGGRIIVPFHSKEMIGIVISFYKVTNVSELNFKYVKSLIDTKSIYTDVVLDLLMWINNNYYCPIGHLFFSVLPKLLRDGYIIKNKYVYQWSITKKGRELDSNQLKKRKKQLYTLLFLKQHSVLTTQLKKYNLSKFILKKLEMQELCKMDIYYKPCIKNKYTNNIKRNFFLNKKILININNIVIKECFSSWLLTKINLYIKVKFYLGLIRSILYKDVQILILVPYIKYINIILVFLRKYFNVSIDIMHSQLTHTKYLKNWIRTKNGENSIVIGTKNSVFLPFLKLGMIIVLEEHNLNYKNVNQYRYNVRDIGILRAYKENIPIILDSETPSLKTLHNILSKKCFYIKLHQHNYIAKLNNSILDLKKEKIKYGLSLTLINEIHKNFKKKQVLLIFNKFSLFFFVLSCNACGWIFKCTSCNDYFEINQYYHVLLCKFCLIKINKPIFCCNCGCISLRVLNISIENIKNKIQSIFPEIPVFFLLNKKHIQKKISSRKIFEFSTSDPYIIITTEEIVQNYFFPHVKLISLICIDNHFLAFQFRKIEYFAQFYINLNKLTNNGNKLTKILIQTTFSDDSDLQELCNNGYFPLINKILEIRKNFLLPPWTFQTIIYVESLYSESNIIFLSMMRKLLKIKSKKYNCFLWLVGPNRLCLFKNNKKCFHQLLIQYSSRAIFNNILNESMHIMNLFSIAKKIKWFIDIEPN